MHFDHYTIRLLTLNDLDDYYEMVTANRHRLASFFAGTVLKTSTKEDTKIFLQEMELKVKEKIYFPYIIIDENNGAIAGFLDIKNIDWNIPKAELGCYIEEQYAGKGLGVTAFNHFCNFCFEEYGFEKLFLRTHESNTAARRGAESCGFEVEGVIRKDYKTTTGELVDLIYYGRLRCK